VPRGDYEVTVTGRAGSSGTAKLAVPADATVAPLRVELHPSGR
jgi:hypothetical protein